MQMERVLLDRIALAAAALLTAGSCAGSIGAQSADTPGSQDLSPELAALVAQPQTGSFNPDASKDVEFFRNTPERFRPFIAVCNPWDEWDKPAPPFRIHGNTYYVGTCGIAAILIVSENGHVLIDTGTRKGAEFVAANIQSLGFELTDIKSILYSHEHFDHVGGHAYMQRLTGAKVLVGPGTSASLFSQGKTSPEDPQFGSHPDMEPIPEAAISLLDRADGGERPFAISVGATELTMHRTPGHSPGALSWQWESCESEQCLSIVYADSLSPISADGYAFSKHPDYLAAYFEGLERLSLVECDILLTPHPSHSRMLRRMRKGAMIDPASCAYYAIDKANDLEERVAREARGDE